MLDLDLIPYQMSIKILIDYLIIIFLLIEMSNLIIILKIIEW